MPRASRNQHSIRFHESTSSSSSSSLLISYLSSSTSIAAMCIYIYICICIYTCISNAVDTKAVDQDKAQKTSESSDPKMFLQRVTGFVSKQQLILRSFWGTGHSFLWYYFRPPCAYVWGITHLFIVVSAYWHWKDKKLEQKINMFTKKRSAP